MSPHEKLASLRRLMDQQQIDAWITPSADPHQSEYVAEHWQARAWLSGFTGSAGTLVVTREFAGLWADRRYHIRAQQELAGSGIHLFKMGLPGVPTYAQWLAQHLPDEANIGFDGKLFSIAQVAELSHAVHGQAIAFTYHENLIDRIWSGRPAPPSNSIYLFDETFAGESRAAKLQRIRRELRNQGAQAQLLTALDDIAWTFNIRGADIAHNPVPICYAFVGLEEACLFIDPGKVPSSIRDALAKDSILLVEYDLIDDYLVQLSPSTVILLDPEQTNYKLKQTAATISRLRLAASIPKELKAIKNETELEGFRQAHRCDGAALIKWLHWLDKQGLNQAHTEITLGHKLLEFRQLENLFQGLSFDNIIGFGANSAVGHYSPRADTAPIIGPEGLLLVDTGGHYLCGTTDVTRTITVGSPTPAEKLAYTQVLKCLIRLITTQFPQGTSGGQLDALARQPLWQQGWDCRHGIGHGVGHFLNVHEGPQRLSPNHPVPLFSGMVTTNEPGVYFEGQFGVRLENVMIVQPSQSTAFGRFLEFETVTLCPFDLDLVEIDRLSLAEKEWLNQYHKKVVDQLAGHLNSEEREWLAEETQPI